MPYPSKLISTVAAIRMYPFLLMMELVDENL